MVRKYVVCVLFLAFVSLSASSPINLKIFGGEDTKRNRYPWQALVLTTTIHKPSRYILCGGVLVHKDWVLTATQCTENFRRVQVMFGVWNTTNRHEKHRRSYDALTVIKNPCGDTSVFSSANLAMIKLNNSREERESVVCLPKHPVMDWQSIEMGVQLNDCIATGYGAVESKKRKPATVLQEVEFTGVSKSSCSGHYRDKIPSDKICGHGRNKPADTCYGDQGGPLLCAATREADRHRRPSPSCSSGFYLTGITSSGSATCGSRNQPAVFTAVFPYIRWIRSVMAAKKLGIRTSRLCHVSGGGGLKSKNVTDPIFYPPPYGEGDEDDEDEP